MSNVAGSSHTLPSPIYHAKALVLMRTSESTERSRTSMPSLSGNLRCTCTSATHGLRMRFCSMTSSSTESSVVPSTTPARLAISCSERCSVASVSMEEIVKTGRVRRTLSAMAATMARMRAATARRPISPMTWPGLTRCDLRARAASGSASTTRLPLPLPEEVPLRPWEPLWDPGRPVDVFVDVRGVARRESSLAIAMPRIPGSAPRARGRCRAS